MLQSNMNEQLCTMFKTNNLDELPKYKVKQKK